MMRRIALVALVLVTIQVAAPALAPHAASAATETSGPVMSGGIPWSKIWNFIKSFGPLLIALWDALTSPSGGGGSGDPPPPPRSPSFQPDTDLAALGFALPPPRALVRRFA